MLVLSGLQLYRRHSLEVSVGRSLVQGGEARSIRRSGIDTHSPLQEEFRQFQISKGDRHIQGTTIQRWLSIDIGTCVEKLYHLSDAVGSEGVGQAPCQLFAARGRGGFIWRNNELLPKETCLGVVAVV